MSYFNIFMSLLPPILVFVVFSIPTCRILNRMGFSRWHVLWNLVPIVNLYMLWKLSRMDWPALRRKDDDGSTAF